FHAQKHTKHIGVEDGLIAFGGHIGGRPGIPHSASLIDGNVEATETSDDLVDKVLDLVFVPHIDAHKFAVSAEVAEFTGKFLTFIVVSTGNNDLCSFMREGQGRGAADSGKCACN